MKTRRIELRMKGELALWVDTYAEMRGSTRTAVIEAALESFRADTESGVPDLEQAPGGAVREDARGVRPAGGRGGSSPSPASAEDRGSAEVSRRPGRGSATDGARVAPSRPAPPRVPGVKTARELYSEQMMERQARLNKQRGL